MKLYCFPLLLITYACATQQASETLVAARSPAQEKVVLTVDSTSQDKFSWMEENTPKLKSWLEGEQLHTEAYLRRDEKAYKTVRSIVEARFRSSHSLSELKVRGDKAFFKISSPQSNSSAYATAKFSDNKYTVVFDPKAPGPYQDSSIIWAEPDETGQLITFGLSRNLEENGEAKVFDLSKNAFLRDTIKGISTGFVGQCSSHNLIVKL